MPGFNLSAWALRHRPLVIYLMLALTVGGILSYLRLGRNEDPAFVIKTMIVQTNWPGATLDETLKQVTERLERKLQETPGLDFLRSYTSAGASTIFVSLRGEVRGPEVPDIWYEVRKKVGDIRTTLPQGIVGPSFNDEFGDTFGIVYGFTADGFTHRELRDYVEDARSRLLQVPDVSKIEIVGAQDERVHLEFSPARLAGLGIDRTALIAALQSQNLVQPAGILETADDRIALRVSGSFGSEQDLLAVTFPVGQRMLRIGDVAEIRRGYADPPQPLFRVNGEPAIGLAIVMRDGGDILTLGRNIEREMRAITADLPIGIEPVRVADQPVTVETAIGDFMASLWQSIAIILAVSFISLGMRAGAVVAISIPLTLAVVFPAMEFLGIDLQRVSLGALIIALALLVDDAMSTTDAMVRRLAAGDDKSSAASYAYRTLAFPMLTGTFVTMAGFLPIGFARSSAGEYTFSLFAVVSIALVASWFVAVLFSPLFGVWLLRAPAGTAKDRRPNRVLDLYRRCLAGAMRAKWLTILSTLILFAASVVGVRFVPQQFFPASDRPELLVDLELPQNASIYASEAAGLQLDELLKGNDDVGHWSTYIGSGAIRFYLPLDVQLRNNFIVQAVVVAKDIGARDRLQTMLETALAERLPNAVSRVSPLGLGPPVGSPVQYRVSGPDPESVRDIAFRLARVVGSNPATRDVSFDWIQPGREVRLRINQDEARQLGLSSASIAAEVNAVVSGTTITQLRDDIYLIDVVTRATDDQRASVSALRNLQVPIAGGRTVPLSQFATFEYGQEMPVIWRRDRVPTLTVMADVTPDTLPATVVNALEHDVAALSASLPPSYRIAVGGTVEESAKSRDSVLAVVPLMLFVMLTVLMVQLQSFQRLLIVLSVVPFGLIGIVAALLIASKPLGFVAFLGILSLLGMIARNAVILIDQIDVERAEGRNVFDAVMEASCSRFRPIMLTAISTVLAMIPIAPSVFWGPMAYALMGGLLVATILTLIFLPTLYLAWFGQRGAKHALHRQGAGADGPRDPPQ